MIIQHLKNNRFFFLILLLAAITFIPALNGTYLMDWDDNQQILENIDVLSLSWTSIQKFFSTYYIHSYQPLASLSFSIEYFIFGPNPFIPHLVNYLLHLLNIFLVFQFLSALFSKQKKLVLLSTAIFALNPIQTEAIAWISTRSTLLFSTLYLLSCWRYVISIKENRKKELALCILFFILSLFSKAAAITLPLTLLLIDFVLKRKIDKRVILEKIPFFILSLIFGCISIFSRELGPGKISEFALYYSIFERVCLASYSYLFYIWKAIFPFRLHNIYEYPFKDQQNLLSLEYPISFIFILSSLLLVIFYRKKILPKFSHEMIFGFLFFSFNIFLVLSFFSFSLAMLAERYEYMALIGLSVLFVSTLEKFIKNAQLKTLFNLVFPLIFISYAVLAFQQCLVWKDQTSLWTHSVQNSKSTYAYVRYAKLLHAQNDLRGALDYLNSAVKINASDPEIYLERGFLIIDLGDFAYAKKDFTRVIDAKSAAPERKAWAYLGRAKANHQLNDIEGALKDLDTAIQLSPKAEMITLKNELTSKQNPLPTN